MDQSPQPTLKQGEGGDRDIEEKQGEGGDNCTGGEEGEGAEVREKRETSGSRRTEAQYSVTSCQILLRRWGHPWSQERGQEGSVTPSRNTLEIGRMEVGEAAVTAVEVSAMDMSAMDMSAMDMSAMDMSIELSA